MRLSALRRRAAAADGFTLPALMGTLLVVSLLSVAAFAAANGDVPLGVDDTERKQAYAAAEAGVNDYVFRLLEDNAYWRTCADPANPALNLRLARGATRRWATLPDSRAQFSIEVLPAPGRAQCDTGSPETTFVDPATGTFRIRSTGRAHAGADAPTRSLVATFRRTGFLDYIYFTDLESSDPAWGIVDVEGLPTRENPPRSPQRDVVRWAYDECTRYWRDGRGNQLFVGYGRDGNPDTPDLDSGVYYDPPRNDLPLDWYTHAQRCDEIRFVGGAEGTDRVNGPLHTNDELLICGTPAFGRGPGDAIEVGGPGPGRRGEGWRADSSCPGSRPQVNVPGSGTVDRDLGTLKKNAAAVRMPPSNRALKSKALDAYRFVGQTTIVLDGTRMLVWGQNEVTGERLEGRALPFPSTGVVYVANAACGEPYAPLAPLSAPATCGTARVRGTYSRSLTIGAENDVLVLDDVTRPDGSDALLGLVGNNWVRVHHPLRNGRCADGNDPNGPRSPFEIDAAILALNHSFTVDSNFCGAKLGTLAVHGAIAQRYRGPVGRGGASAEGNGYIKAYTYDEQLRFRSPPSFLDPVESAWRLQSLVEQVPSAA